jgi:gliding motility-associated-like protein
MGKLLGHIYLYVFICIVYTSNAQFIYEESCMNTSGIFSPKGHAYYTVSKGIDAPGQGWLRLTDDTNDQLGYVLAEGTYSSKLGLTVEFDFVVWTSVSSTPADGFSVFLFDGAVTNDKFIPGGKGGALGYLPRDSERGQSDSYIGIGIDEFGNYTNYVNNGFHPNAITICGPSSENYRFLASTFSNLSQAKDHDLINTTIPFPEFSHSRPSESQYFRRVKVELTPDDEGMTINVYLKINVAGAFMHVLGPVNITSRAPDFLRVGFAGVTGGSTAVHEVRNVIIRTSGNLLAFKSIDKCVKSTETPVNVSSNIYNGSPNMMNNLEILDTLPANFVVTDVSITGGSWTFSPPSLTGTPSTDGRVAYKYFVNIADNMNAKITWAGYFNSLTKDAPVVSSVYVVPVPGDFLSDDNYASDTVYFTPSPQTNDIEVCRFETINMIPVDAVKKHTVKWFDSNMRVLANMPSPNSGIAGKQIYYVEYSSDIAQCESDKAKLEINVLPTPEYDFDIVISNPCYGDTSVIGLKNLTNSSIYNIYQDSLMSKKIVSITGVNEYSRRTEVLQDTQNYYIQVSNSYSCVSKDLTKVTIQPVKVLIFTDKIPAFKEKSEYNYRLESNAESPYFSIISGNLPAGIIMDISGLITGKTETGTYGNAEFTVQVTDKYECISSKSYSYDIDIFIPNAFTPNGDEINDVFLKGFRIIITDRSGVKIFEGNDGWDGTYNGKTAPDNIYFYTAYISNKIITGYIGLIR